MILLWRCICLFCAAIVPVSVTAATTQEAEPNNELAKAMPIEYGTSVAGTVHFGDGHDYYKLTLPRAGRVVATVSGFPADCAFQVMALGFDKYPTASIGWTDGEPGRPAAFAFNAKAGSPGHIAVRLRNSTASTSRGNWGAVQCVKNGPWYTTPLYDKATGPGPAQHEGCPVKPPIHYVLTIAYADEAGTQTSTPGSTPGGTTRQLDAAQARPYLERADAFWQLVFANQIDQALLLTSDDFRKSVAEMGKAAFAAGLLKHGKGTFAAKGAERLADGSAVAGGILQFADRRTTNVVMLFQGDKIDSISGRYGKPKNE